MQLRHQPRQIGQIKILGSRPSIESGIQAEIDRIRAVFNRRADAVPIARGGEEFGSDISGLGHWLRTQVHCYTPLLFAK